MIKDLRNKKFRDDYLYFLMTHRLALQVKVNRKARGFSIKKLSRLSGLCIKDIKAIERAKFGHLPISFMHKLAKAFGCAVEVKFQTISSTVCQIEHGIELLVPTYEEEFRA